MQCGKRVLGAGSPDPASRARRRASHRGTTRTCRSGAHRARRSPRRQGRAGFPSAGSGASCGAHHESRDVLRMRRRARSDAGWAPWARQMELCAGATVAEHSADGGPAMIRRAAAVEVADVPSASLPPCTECDGGLVQASGSTSTWRSTLFRSRLHLVRTPASGAAFAALILCASALGRMRI